MITHSRPGWSTSGGRQCPGGRSNHADWPSNLRDTALRFAHATSARTLVTGRTAPTAKQQSASSTTQRQHTDHSEEIEMRKNSTGAGSDSDTLVKAEASSAPQRDSRLRLPTMRRSVGLIRAEPGNPGCKRVRPLAARGLAAMLLVAFATLLGLTAHAQTAIDLVSNRTTAGSQNIAIPIGGDTNSARGQKFTIPAGASYTLSAITIKINTVGTEGVSVTLRENGSSSPGSVLYTMMPPGSVSTGFNTFTAPTGARLEADTTYFVMVTRGQSAGTGSEIAGLAHNGQTGLTGWSISDLSHRRTNSIWVTQWGSSVRHPQNEARGRGDDAQQRADLRRRHEHDTGVQRDDRQCDGDDGVGHRRHQSPQRTRTPATRSNTP